jgi:hypothetical protein
MHGSLCLKNGILYVGRHASTAHVQPYDLDGHRIGDGFSFRGEDGRSAAVTGIDIDDDHRLWIADGAGERLRTFSLFGRELPAIEVPRLERRELRGAEGSIDESGDSERVGGPTDRSKRSPGRFEGLVDVAASGIEADLELLIVRGGRRRHALELLEVASGRVRSLRPDGDPQGSFEGLQRAAIRGNLVYACEAGAGRVQVFRGGAFHYLFRLPMNPGASARFEPRAVAPLADGRMVIAQGGLETSALLLVEPGGRILRVLAEHGEAAGNVIEPSDVAVEEGDSDHRSRAAVIDCDGDRVQVFTLAGACFGSFADLPRGDVESSAARE